jgi:hypothetical protein
MFTLGPSLSGLKGTQVMGSIIYTLVNGQLSPAVRRGLTCIAGLGFAFHPPKP